MKKLLTKALGVVLSLAVAASCLAPATVHAAVEAPKKQTVYLTSKKGENTTAICVSGLTKDQKIKKSSVKSSKKSVAKLFYLERYAAQVDYSSEFYEDNYDNYDESFNYAEYYIYLKVKKAGTTTISYKVDNKKYTTVLTVKNYTNPLKEVKITGINSGKDIAKKLKNQNNANITLKKNVSDAILKLKANKNWKITNVSMNSLEKESDGYYYVVEQYSYYTDKKRSSVNLNVGDLKAKGAYRISVTMQNTKDGGTLNCYYYINY